jgi:hypothetical protein
MSQPMQHKDDPKGEGKPKKAGAWLAYQAHRNEASWPVFKAWYRFGQATDLQTWLNKRFERGDE